MQAEQYKSFIICTSPRSGSTLLCKLLSATKIAGNPGSHFHTPSVARWLEVYELADANFATERDAVAAIFEAARERGTSDTGIFGLRLQRGSVDFFLQQLGILFAHKSDDRDRIEAAFGPTLFIHLSRSDKLDQAISYVKASQTGLWHKAPDGTELERLSAPSEPFYDAGAIAKYTAKFSAMDEAWRGWFEHQKISPMELSYDDLSADPIGQLGVVLAKLGLDGNVARQIELPVAKLADATNQQWADRFKAEQVLS